MKVVTVKYGRSTHELTLEGSECVYARVASTFGIPVRRIVLIRAGKKLPPQGSPDLAAALALPGVIMLTGTDARLSTPTERAADEAQGVLADVWQNLTWANVRRRAVDAVAWVWSVIAAIPRLAISFVSSAAMPPARPAQRREQRDD